MTGSMAGTLGEIQPFRYRGYVYDVETDLYYLRSRYYSHNWQRFLNADKIISTTQIIGCNSFSYYFNNPLIFSDEHGTLPPPGMVYAYGNAYETDMLLAKSIVKGICYPWERLMITIKQKDLYEFIED